MSEGTGVSKPHGGNLVNRFSNIDPSGLSSISINADLANDVENIADGIFSPLEGFLSQQDFESVVSKGRLSNDIPWTIPIVLDVDESTASKIKDSGNVLLKNPDGLGVAVLNVEEVFTFDKEKTVKGIYGTDDNSHPGVAKTTAMNDFLVSGKIDYIKRPENTEIRKFRMTPLETRESFSKAGWKKIVAFQTRNPPHVAHEILQKTAITTRDGVFVNPLIGKKKSGDFKDEVIVKSYVSMIENYYPENRCKLGTLHTEMRYAGPKEAIHHAIMRQNYGCTHIIIGRDHAGVGKFYDPFAAQKIFDDYQDLEIAPISSLHSFTAKNVLHLLIQRYVLTMRNQENKLAALRLRSLIQEGSAPSEFILRPEVAKVILSYDKPFVD